MRWKTLGGQTHPRLRGWLGLIGIIGNWMPVALGSIWIRAWRFHANQKERRLMTVRAKFYVKQINHMHHGQDNDATEITMAPVFGTFGDGSANESWSKHTPSGELTMMITNPAAVEKFEIGKSYYLDFTPAD